MKRVFEITFILLLALSVCVSYAEAISLFDIFKIKQGNTLYEKGKYKEAEKKYTEVNSVKDQTQILPFNMGDALYKQNKFEESLKNFSKSLENASDYLSRIYYNMANSCYKMNKNDEAIKYYKESLRNDPNDMDAKYNLEFLLKKEEQNKKNKDKKDGKKQNDKKDKDKNNQDKTTQNDNKNSMNKQDEDNLMNMIKDEEKKAKEKVQPKVQFRNNNDKDW